MDPKYLKLDGQAVQDLLPSNKGRRGAGGAPPGNRTGHELLNIEAGWWDPGFTSLPSSLLCPLTFSLIEKSEEAALGFLEWLRPAPWTRDFCPPFSGGPSRAPPLLLPLLFHLLLILWRILGLGSLEPWQGASSLSILKRFLCWVPEDHSLPSWETSLSPMAVPREPLPLSGGQQGTTFAVQVRYQLNQNYQP